MSLFQYDEVCLSDPAVVVEMKVKKARSGDMCVDLIDLERVDIALFIIDVSTALNALPV